ELGGSEQTSNDGAQSKLCADGDIDLPRDEHTRHANAGHERGHLRGEPGEQRLRLEEVRREDPEGEQQQGQHGDNGKLSRKPAHAFLSSRVAYSSAQRYCSSLSRIAGRARRSCWSASGMLSANPRDKR